MIGKLGRDPSAGRPQGAGLGLYSQASPEVPPDLTPPAAGTGRDWFAPAATGPSSRARSAVGEPTQTLPFVPQQPKVAARAVIVYQERPRRPWLLWAFTAVLVALTVGVILGQTVAFEPTYRSTANAAQAVTVPSVIVPSSGPGVGPIAQSPGSPASSPDPAGAQRVTAPLGTGGRRLLEVIGSSAALHIRTVDLGGSLFDIATTDRSALPQVTDTAQGSRLELVRTGEPGTVNVEIQLSTKVAWTLRLTGGSTEQNLDLRAGGIAPIRIAGETARLVLQLPRPTGTVPLSITGPIGRLVVRSEAGTPLRLRLGAGATSVVLNGKTHTRVKPGAVLTSTGWASAKNRYDLATAAPIADIVAKTL